ncbi:hypothetical protein ACLKMY_34240 [Paraburkholderia mimosarum]|uniref:hypothetical protein n=1 Tax=Paraburkholderia mimosarum TaxID=312026 RepID=UPI0039C2AFD4
MEKTVIDLSLVPAEVVRIVTAVIARMTLKSLQRYRKINKGRTLPTVLVMEEAHTFIRRYNDDAENQNAASLPSRHAILLAWASELPVLVEMRLSFLVPRTFDVRPRRKSPSSPPTGRERPIKRHWAVGARTARRQ